MKSRNTNHKAAWMAMIVSTLVFAGYANAQIKVLSANTDYDIEDFLIKQYQEFIDRGTTTGGGWVNESDRNGDGQLTFPQDERQFQMVFDWTGYVDYLNGGAFGTEMTGYVKERPLGGGMSLFTVHVEAKQAIIYVWECFAVGSCALDPNVNLVFGNTPADVLGGAEPALADIEMDLQMYGNTGEIPTFFDAFINWLGDPNPETTLPNMRQFHLKINALGPLHEAFGEGVQDGDPGKLFWAKQGLNSTKPAQEGVDVDNNKGAHEAYPSQSFYLKPIQ